MESLWIDQPPSVEMCRSSTEGAEAHSKSVINREEGVHEESGNEQGIDRNIPSTQVLLLLIALDTSTLHKWQYVPSPRSIVRLVGVNGHVIEPSKLCARCHHTCCVDATRVAVVVDHRSVR